MDKEIKTREKHLIRRLWDYVSGRSWALYLCLFVAQWLFVIVLFVLAKISWLSFQLFFLACAWVILWLLIWLFYSFYGAYSTGVDEGYEVANKPQPKMVEIRDTWPSHIFHACKTLILLLFVIFFFPWFIVYRLGKWRGRKEYRALDKKWKKVEDAKRVRISEQEKYTYEYYDNPSDHTPNAYGYTGDD
jgi:hypothetical protein